MQSILNLTPILFQVWIRIQANTFKNWANVTLREAGSQRNIENLESDLQDGTILVSLVETLQKRKLKHNKKPINQHHEIENITIALDAIQEDGLKLVNIGKIINFDTQYVQYKSISKSIDSETCSKSSILIISLPAFF